MASKPSAVELAKILTTLEYQFPEIKIYEIPKISVSRSKKTKRVNEVYSGEHLLFTLRPMDGRFIPTMEGGRFLMEKGLKTNIVVAMEEAVPFVSKGKSLFNKHVQKTTENVTPNSEVLVLDPKGNLIAVGTSQHPSYAMEQLDNGVAVKVKHYQK